MSKAHELSACSGFTSGIQSKHVQKSISFLGSNLRSLLNCGDLTDACRRSCVEPLLLIPSTSNDGVRSGQTDSGHTEESWTHYRQLNSAKSFVLGHWLLTRKKLAVDSCIICGE